MADLVNDLIVDIRGRAGLGDAWDEMDHDVRALVVAAWQRIASAHTAAAVERERERCAAYCEKRAADEKRDALACAEVSLSGCHDVGAYDRGRIEALRDAASALRSRPPRAGAEATNATREARPRCTTCGDSGWSIDDESNRRRCSCAAAGRGEVGRG